MGFSFRDGEVQSYYKAQSILKGRDERKIANNTRLIKQSEDSISIRHWSTDIITFYQDGRILIDTNGYHTVTTIARLNAYLPRYRIGSDRGSMVIYDSETGVDYEYNDGMIINADGSVTGLPRICGRLNTWYSVHKIEKTVETREQVIEAIQTMSLEDLMSVWKRLRKDRYLIAEHCQSNFLPVIATQSGSWDEVVSRRLSGCSEETQEYVAEVA